VGRDPLARPAPLEALEGYRLAFASPQKAAAGSAQLPEVKIFEYTPQIERAQLKQRPCR